jgi:hypothetical protein
MVANVEQAFFPKAFLVVATLTAYTPAAAAQEAASISATAQTQTTQAQTTQAKEYPYYVEFRVAVDGVYGHSYIAYGRLDLLGRPMTASYADIHPTGDLPSMVLGHFLPMEAATSPEQATLHYEIASRYRRQLTATEYGKLQSVLARIRAAHHFWNVLAYNCNDFVADVAHGMGMRSPMTLLLPYDFIPTLRVINEHTLHPVAATKLAPMVESRR